MCGSGPFGECRGVGVGASFSVALESGGYVLSFGSHPGLFVAGSFTLFAGELFGLRFGARMGLDFEVARFEGPLEARLLVSPSVLVGLSVGTLDASFALELTGDVKLLLLEDRLSIWLRPFASDMQFAQFFSWRTSLLAGAAVHY